VNPDRAPRPDWLKVRAPSGKRVEEVSGRSPGTVSARCAAKHGAPMWGVLGGRGGDRDPAGRHVHAGLRLLRRESGEPAPPDPSEPDRVAKRRRSFSWRHVVVTSVTRDDLPDGGAAHFASVVRALRREAPGAAVELLVPDFAGNVDALRCVVDAAPDILAHNVETVPRLYRAVRKGRSTGGPWISSAAPPRCILPAAEVRDHGRIRGDRRGGGRGLPGPLRRGVPLDHGGQYLPPSRDHVPLSEYVPPDQFERFAESARGIGFDRVLSGPLVRSSYNPQPRA